MSALDKTSPDAVRSLRAPFDGGAFVRSMAAGGLLGDADARVAEEVARRNGTTAVRAVLDLGLMSEEALADAIAAALGASRFDSSENAGALSDALPGAFMRSSGVLLFESDEDEGASCVAVVSDPSDGPSRRALVQRAGDRLGAVRIATAKQVTAYLDESEESLPEEESHAGEDVDVSGELSALRELASEAPVVRFFNQTVDRAMDLGASDIHIERYARRTSMRFRVDGVLVEQGAPPSAMYDALLCRVKIMAGLDIAERRRAQDGRVQMKFRGRAVDMRVSLVPTMYGQDAAIRIQDRQRLGAIELRDLGFEEGHLRTRREASSKSHGIVLITGPTGSGKTTTLYALLREMASSARKIVTVEDPVEYAMDGINQIQVNSHVGLSFGTTLRHVLRHDPDVILVGEIRDRETAEMAFQSALTGHMVLSTLHTNDVPSSFVRLTDMGVEPYLVNSAVEGVSAQRLLRTVCPECKNEPGVRESCTACKGLGYRGRVAVMEMALTTGAIKRAMLEGAEEHLVRAALEESGFESMRAHADRLVERGATDHAEVARVLGMRASDDG